MESSPNPTATYLDALLSMFFSLCLCLLLSLCLFFSLPPPFLSKDSHLLCSCLQILIALCFLSSTSKVDVKGVKGVKLFLLPLSSFSSDPASAHTLVVHTLLPKDPLPHPLSCSNTFLTFFSDGNKWILALPSGLLY